MRVKLLMNNATRSRLLLLVHAIARNYMGVATNMGGTL